MRERIRMMLQQSGGAFVSGEQISKALGVSRAAVWKHVQALREAGAQIEAVTRKGYRLVDDTRAPLSGARIAPYLATRALGRNAVFLKSAPSTNQVARELAAKGAAHGMSVLAEEQTAGRGRRGRAWSNSPGQDICLSAILRPRLEAQHAARFTLATALGVYQVAAKLGFLPSIKWPNDVLLGNKKICGILLEMDCTVEEISFIVVGVGLNVNNHSFPAPLCDTATSLFLEAQRINGEDQKPFERAQVLSSLLNALEPLYDACEEDYPSIQKSYTAACSTLGRQITLTGAQGVLHGVAEGIDEIGRLLLRERNGVLHTVSAGDVTLRGS